MSIDTALVATLPPGALPASAPIRRASDARDDAGASPASAPIRRADAVRHDEPHVWTATGLERQVFLDQTGRRGRRMRVFGATAAIASAAWFAAVVTGSIGFSTLPALPSAGALASGSHHIVHTGSRRHRAVDVATVAPTSAASAQQVARADLGEPVGSVH